MINHAPLEVRGVRSTDMDFVRELSQQVFLEFSREPGARTLWMAEHYTCLIAERSAARVGFAVLRLEPQRLAELAAIAVTETERGRGVGHALLRAAELRARQHGAPGIRLHTADANVAALDLFLKAGYQIRRHLPRHYRNMYDACELVKRFVV